MPSVKNPNGPSKNRLAARAARARKQGQKHTSMAGKSRIAKADTRRGARTGLLPTSGPNAVISAKKKRKLDRKMGYALKRKMEGDAEAPAEMKGACVSCLRALRCVDVAPRLRCGDTINLLRYHY